MRKLSVLIICLLCLCMLSPLHIVAAENDSSGENSITLNYYVENNDMPLANASFHIYLAAEPDGSGGYKLSGQFSDYQVDISDLDWNEAGRLTALAVTLSAYADRDKITPFKNGVTDRNGILTFEDLPDGLYLIKGDLLSVDVNGIEFKYMAQPLLLPMPYPGEGGADLNEMEVDVKYDRVPPMSTQEFVNLTVLKVWKGGDEHPNSVTAQLLYDGNVVDSVELNEGNNWKHVWRDVDPGYVCQVLEESVPEGYKVLIDREKYVFTITNSKDDTLGDEEIVTTEAVTTTTESTTTASTNGSQSTLGENTSNTTKNKTTTTTSTDVVTKLPQTGQLWWPVPACLSAGLFLVSIGLIIRSDDKGEKKK